MSRENRLFKTKLYVGLWLEIGSSIIFRETSLNNTQTKFGVSALFTWQDIIWAYASADRFYAFLWLLERKTLNYVRWCLLYMRGTIWWAFDWTNSRPVRGWLYLKYSSSYWMEWVFSINGFCINGNILCSLLDKVGLTIGWNDSTRKIYPCSIFLISWLATPVR